MPATTQRSPKGLHRRPPTALLPKMPTRNAQLAILGGLPLFEKTFHVGRPNLGKLDSFRAELDGILERKWLTNHGPVVVNFEAELQKVIGAKHCIAVCNATVGLEMLATALNLNGEVIVPAWTFVATAHSMLRMGGTPILCDVDPESHCLNPEAVEALITPSTQAILGVHLWGRGHALEQLEAIARRHGLKLIFDAAHAFGCSHQQRMIGNFGDAEVFSFHATKAINCFEGGAIATNDDQLAARLRRIANFGFVDFDQVEDIGTNGKMSEVNAAMGLASLSDRQRIFETNRAHWSQYRALLAELPGIRVYEHPKNESHNYHYAIVEVDENSFGLSRDQLLACLQAERVMARRYFFPGIVNMEPYRSAPERFVRGPLPVATLLAERTLALPNGTAVSPSDIETICSIVTLCHQERAVIAQTVPRTRPLGSLGAVVP